MALRVLLVAMVAALGLELPSSGDLATWRRSGREWVSSRVAELSSFTEDSPADATPEDAPGRGDLAFEAVSEAMTSGFASDLALMRSQPPVDPQGDQVPVVTDFSASPESRLERVSAAVRLTKQAVDAWVSLAQPTAAPVEAGDRDDSL